MESPSIRWVGTGREEAVTCTTFQQVKKEVEVDLEGEVDVEELAAEVIKTS